MLQMADTHFLPAVKRTFILPFFFDSTAFVGLLLFHILVTKNLRKAKFFFLFLLDGIMKRLILLIVGSLDPTVLCSER